MSTPAVASNVDELPRGSRPYRDYPLDVLVELLERQYDQGQLFHEGMVFELAHRAVAAEWAARRVGGR